MSIIQTHFLHLQTLVNIIKKSPEEHIKNSFNLYNKKIENLINKIITTETKEITPEELDQLKKSWESLNIEKLDFSHPFAEFSTQTSSCYQKVFPKQESFQSKTVGNSFESETAELIAFTTEELDILKQPDYLSCFFKTIENLKRGVFGPRLQKAYEEIDYMLTSRETLLMLMFYRLSILPPDKQLIPPLFGSKKDLDEVLMQLKNQDHLFIEKALLSPETLTPQEKIIYNSLKKKIGRIKVEQSEIAALWNFYHRCGSQGLRMFVLLQQKKLDLAITFAFLLQDPERSKTLGLMLQVALGLGELNFAYEIVKEISHPKIHIQSLQQIVHALIDLGDYIEAQKIASSLKDREFYLQTLERMIFRISEDYLADRSNKIANVDPKKLFLTENFLKVLEIENAPTELLDRARYHLIVCYLALPSFDQLSKHLGIVSAHINKMSKELEYLDQSFKALIAVIAHYQKFDLALSLLSCIQNPEERDMALKKIIEQFVTFHHMKDALEQLKNIQADYIKEEALNIIFEGYLEEKNAKDALEIALYMQDSESRDDALIELIFSGSISDNHAFTIDVLMKVENDDKKDEALSDFSLSLIEKKQFNSALDAIEKIKNKKLKDELLNMIQDSL
ncbi:MAG: hypothetical protein ACM3JI_03540 [Anaerolineae bacterium]